ncbi:hypothetical protein GOBAR_DD06891 [Gossypium barbadense]|nr:hypothetical protein GOBAR_DD06891 [Gossypium barbadense]
MAMARHLLICTTSVARYSLIVCHFPVCRYMDPIAGISVFREASFGHGQLEVVNATDAVWTWHRNDDDVSVVSDTAWLKSLSSNPACKS